MKIEFYNKKDNTVVNDKYYFVDSDGSVYCENDREYESQSQTVSFDDFTDPCYHIGWRVINER